MASRANVVNLVNSVAAASCKCPAHLASGAVNRLNRGDSNALVQNYQKRFMAQENPIADYAFEISVANVRYGPGVTQEVGMDLVHLKAKHVGVYTDKNLVHLPVMKTVLEALSQQKINFTVYDNVRVEPTNESILDAANFAIQQDFDAFLAVGGGSVLDTTKAANLYMCDQSADFLDYVAVPIGKGKPVEVPVKPLIAIPTTSGTGSEVTGTSVFDYLPLQTKTGISSRVLTPLLGIVDPLHTLTMPKNIVTFTGFDTFCHALESFTSLTYTERIPRPTNPKFRPAYQGSNPISDVWSSNALKMVGTFFERSVNNSDDVEAKSQMHLASTFAGIGFGNAGNHLCHGLSYSISGLAKNYNPEDYSKEYPIIPHGLSVVITAPAVFNFTGLMSPEKHLEAAKLLGADTTNAKRADAGKILGDICLKYMDRMKIPDGLSSLGYSNADIPALVKGALSAEGKRKLAPRSQTEEDLATIYEDSLTIYN